MKYNLKDIATGDISAKLNNELQKNARGSLHHMLNNIERMGIVDTGSSFKYLQFKLGYDSGKEIDRIGFRMHRYTLLQEHGVGRGHPKNGHNTVKSIEGSKRKPREWFSEALDVQVPIMADTVAKYNGDKVIRNAFGRNVKYVIGK